MTAGEAKAFYQKTLNAMKLLKKHKCLFGTSVCYTSKNYDSVTSDEFYDFMIENGAKFAWYFHYMPVGADADTELLLTPEQREHVYRTIRQNRNSKTGNLFLRSISKMTASLSAAALQADVTISMSTARATLSLAYLFTTAIQI